MRKKYLLPSLRSENEIKQNNCWEEQESPYDFLLEQLKLYYEPNTSIFQGGSNAIPHIYEQMLVFHKAFFNERHPDHQRAVLEWRAVLTLMALKRLQNLKLDLIRVDFNEKSSNLFLQAATMFRPTDKPVFYQTTWDFLYVLSLKNEPIAIFSPITLVCPAKLFFKKIEINMDRKWLSLEQVNGVEELHFDFRMNTHIYASLTHWLSLLESRLECSEPEDGECNKKADQVKVQLRAFINKYSHLSTGGEELTSIRKDVYSSIGNSIRREYDFLNNCCDFHVANPKLEFLVNRYMEDIFEEHLALVVYDERPNSIENTANIAKLEALFPYVLKIKGKSIISVKEYGGRQMAAYILLPFKTQFIEEIIAHRITPEEFFEEFETIYDGNKEQIEITLQIRQFPYPFIKVYSKSMWEYMYGSDMEGTYIWPSEQVDSLYWNLYFTYVSSYNPMKKISIPGIEKAAIFHSPEKMSVHNEFQLLQTPSFPAYLCYSTKNASGYLPIKTSHQGHPKIGGVANVFIDLGHATTCVAIVKTYTNDQGKRAEKFYFKMPKSEEIIHERGKNSTSYNFISSKKNTTTKERNYYKNMVHSFIDYRVEYFHGENMEPLGSGILLYDRNGYNSSISEALVSFLNFEYASMSQQEREDVHTYIEQILLYVVYSAALQNCTYLKVHFIHSCEDNSENAGELYGLWQHAIEQIKSWTGISKDYCISLKGLQEYVALTYSTYHDMKSRIDNAGENSLYIGMDIGWKKTCLTFIENEKNSTQKNSHVKVWYKELNYAGQNISLMGDDDSKERLLFKKYPQILSILLNSTTLIGGNEDDILSKFSDYYKKGIETGKDKKYYQGIYDIIAMMIEDAGYSVSPDVYNNMKEFRKFIQMLTYNILLLFLNTGSLLGEILGKKETVCIFVGGNGAKFFKWISNEKDYMEINKDNSRKLWILNLQKDILNVIMEGVSITGSKEDIPKNVRIIIKPDAKEQMVDGYIYKELPFLEEDEKEFPEFQYEELKNQITSTQKLKLLELTKEILFDVFKGDICGDYPATSGHEDEDENNIEPRETLGSTANKEASNTPGESAVSGNGTGDSGESSGSGNGTGDLKGSSNSGNNANLKIVSHLQVNNTPKDDDYDSTKIIDITRRKVCKQVIENINKM